MKKTLIISAIALCGSLVSLNAHSIESNETTSYNVSQVVRVNPFCTSIAKGDIETVKKLISLGEDVNRKSNGMSPAMYAAKYNRVEILKLLIDKGANLRARSAKGMTAKEYAKQSSAKEALALIKSSLSKKKNQ